MLLYININLYIIYIIHMSISINQSIKSPKRHTSTREATHPGTYTREANPAMQSVAGLGLGD